MDSEVDRQIASSRELMRRVTEDAAVRGGRAIRVTHERVDARGNIPGRVEIGRRLTRIALADAAILIVAVVIGFFSPLGLFGALAVIALMIAATLVLAMAPTARAPSPEKLRAAPIKALPEQTGRWLEAQRPALPAPAATLVDQIGVRLDTLSPQLATLDENDPAAQDIRKLVGEQLPDFVRGYTKVPPSLRGVARNGRTPDAELTDGLKLIETEIGEMTQRLAASDLDQLATRGRFLEIKYRDDGASDTTPALPPPR